jgi:hypothetical protein
MTTRNANAWRNYEAEVDCTPVTVIDNGASLCIGDDRYESCYYFNRDEVDALIALLPQLRQRMLSVEAVEKREAIRRQGKRPERPGWRRADSTKLMCTAIDSGGVRQTTTVREALGAGSPGERMASDVMGEKVEP